MTTAFSQNIRSICCKLPLLMIRGSRKPSCVRELSSLSSSCTGKGKDSSYLEALPTIPGAPVTVFPYRRPLSLSPSELISSLEYTLPTTCINTVIHKGRVVQNGAFQCPAVLSSQPMSAPSGPKPMQEPGRSLEIIAPERHSIEKLAKNVLKIRRKKMNRHHLKKLRKRMKFVFRKHSHRKKKLREEKLQAQFRDIMKRAEDFDPKDFVQKKIELARKGGYHVDLFESLKKQQA